MKRRRGFTLVEVVVVIGVIMLLVGLTLSVTVSVLEASERHQTEQVLRLLEDAVRQWELAAERTLSWWDFYDPEEYRPQADVHADTPRVLIITEILAVIGRRAEIRSILAALDPRLVYTYRGEPYPAWIDTDPERQQVADRFGGAITVLDAWGTPIYATHPGRPHDPATYPDELTWYPRPDPDGTIRTYNEQDYGIAPNRQVVFVSAGPDRLFGLAHDEFPGLAGAPLAAAVRDARRDNLYSVAVTFE